MRETGWSPIYCRRRFLKRLVPSKKLLLCLETNIENATHNGEAFICFWFENYIYVRSSHNIIRLRIKSLYKVIPWEAEKNLESKNEKPYSL